MHKLWIKKVIMIFSFVAALGVVTPFLVSCTTKSVTENTKPDHTPPPNLDIPVEPTEPYIETEYFKLFYNIGVIRANEKYDPLYGVNYQPLNYLPENFVIPSEINGYKVTKIDKSAFSQQKFNSVIIEEGIEFVDGSAFNTTSTTQQCEFTIPSSLETLAKSAFRSCNITKFDLSHTKVTTIPENAYYANKHLREIIISKNIKTIENDAFDYVPKVEHMVIEEGVETIGDDAFNGLGNPNGSGGGNYTKNISIKLPKSLISLGKRAFYEAAIKKLDISNLNNFTFAESCFEGAWLNEFKIPVGSNHTFEKNSFRGTDIKEIFIPKGTIVKDYAFYSNYLTSIGIADDFDIDLTWSDYSKKYIAADTQTFLGKNIFGSWLEIQKENLQLPPSFYNRSLPATNLGISPMSWDVWSLWKLMNMNK